MQTQVQRYLLAISMLMVLWLLLRSIKFSIANADAERWLWYFYYVPILFIPMLSVFVSQSLGKPEDFSFAAVDKTVVCADSALRSCHSV